MSSVRIIRAVSVALVALLGAPPVSAGQAAATADEHPSLQALVQEALARNPDLRAAEEALKAAGSRPAQVSALPDPMLSLEYRNDGWAPSLGSEMMTTLGVMASQAFPYPGKRRLRGQIASLEAEQAQQALERVRLGVTAAVKQAYYDLVLTRQLLRLVHEQEETWKQVEGVTRARYSVGQGIQQDILRVQVEVTRIEQQRVELETAAEVRSAELNRLLDRPSNAPPETDAPLALQPEARTLEAMVDALSSISPDLKAAELAVERDRRVVELARKQFKPDFALQAGYMNRGGLDPMWQAGVSVSLPVYRKRLRAGVAEADARLRASEARLRSARLQLRARTQERLARLGAAEKLAGLYANGIVPQTRLSVESALANYQAGRVPFVTVLEALARLYGDRSAYLGLLAEHARGRVRLEEASLEGDGPMGLPVAPAATGMTMATGVSPLAAMPQMP